jgi:hypothetical protein
MKTKRLKNKRLLRLNKTTIVNLNHQEMVKIKVGTGKGAQVNADSDAKHSRCCIFCTNDPDTHLNFSFVQDCNLNLNTTDCLIPVTDTC